MNEPAASITALPALPPLPPLSQRVSHQDWRDVLHLLDTALELEPSAQTHWLAALGPQHARLSPLLKELLDARAAVGTGDFMRAPPTFAAGRAVDSASAPPEPGAHALVGPYRLLREIGQGGMASVWLAERADGLIERQVALKLPHVSWGAADFASRMARERNILASLTHPHIARLYDAGLAADGRPFLALEYVDGQPIDAWAAARSLGLHQRVELIVQVARAVAHAHSRLVVHRDLKPSNILVDAQGQTHLLDFGIAKLIDLQLGDDANSTQLTQAAGRALTPDYASPEQIRGETIGTASDVYSLGVVAFELLTGQRPYRLHKGLGAAALAEAIVHAAVPRASTTVADTGLCRALQGDIDAILARMLEKESSQRYPTMAALADDLERHLRGEAVHARPPSRWYVAERWVRRHKLETAVGAAIVIAVPAGAAAQAAVLTAIAAGAAAALWQAQRARRQTQLARDEAARAAAVKAFLTSFFKSGSLDEDRGAQLGRLSVQQFVERGARRIGAGFENQPAVKAELLDVVSTLFADLSDGAATAEYARQWLRTLDEAGAHPGERARANQRLAQGLSLLGRHAEASALLERSIASLRARNEAASNPVLAQLLVDQAWLHNELGDRQRALAGANQALALLGGNDSGNNSGNDSAINSVVNGANDSASSTAAQAHFLRAELTAVDNRLAEAVPLFDDAIARLERLHGERSVAVARHRFLYAAALSEGLENTSAEREYRHALQILREAGGEGDLNAAIVELELGRLIAIAGIRRDEGIVLLQRAAAVFAQRAGDVSPIYPARANLYLAEALIDDGDFERAAQPMHTAVRLFDEQVESAPQRAMARLIHARFLSECGDYDGADRVLEQARDEHARLFGAAHPLTAVVTNRIGLNHLRKLDLERAKATFQEVLGSQDQGGETGDSAKAMARQNLAVTQLAAGDIDAALPVLQRCYALNQALPADQRNVMSEASFSLNLGRAWLQAGQPASALPLLQRSVEILAAAYPRSPGLASSRSWLGLCLLALGQARPARALAEQARLALDAQPSAGVHYRRPFLLLTERLAALPAPASPP